MLDAQIDEEYLPGVNEADNVTQTPVETQLETFAQRCYYLFLGAGRRFTDNDVSHQFAQTITRAIAPCYRC